MPYNLLYTRPISSDDRVRFTDVPITSPSIMVDILSLRSPFYRIAGYAYSIVSDGVIDYERGAGYTLPFGKNRLLFPASPLPYFLEFFPKWGMKTGIISVYVGEPAPPPPPPTPWVGFPAYGVEFRRAQNPGRLEYRSPIGSNIVQSMAPGFYEGCYLSGYLNWGAAGGSYHYSPIDNLAFEGVTDYQRHFEAMSNPASVFL